MVAFNKNYYLDLWLNLCRAEFAPILPEVVQEANAALCGVPEKRRRALVEEVIRHAFKTFVRLAERGKIQIAYAKPLTLVGIEQLGEERRIRRPR